MIRADQLPEKLKVPTFEKYEGKIDPTEHLSYFNSVVGLYNYDGPTRCKLFPSSFKGAARSWFTRLPARSIASFEEMAKRFALAFLSSKPADVESDSLIRVRQRTGESLREYWKRFNEEMLKIKGVDPKIAFIALKNGIWDHRVITDINLKKPKDMQSMVQRIHEFIHVDDELASWASLAGEKEKKRK